jgi:hypothetical protein
MKKLMLLAVALMITAGTVTVRDIPQPPCDPCKLVTTILT